jgi:purine-binding chemotaxis protein CheW
MGEQVQVLEFRLGTERYCIDIDHIEEVVEKDEDDLTPMPNAPPHVSGVTDLRGQTTTIIDPKGLLGLEPGGHGSQVIVFDGESAGFDGVVGWAVDEVFQVSTIATADVEDAAHDDTVEGVVNREDGFLILTSPLVAAG